MTEKRLTEVLTEAIRGATQEVFQTMLGIEMAPGEVYEDSSGEDHPSTGVVSLVGLTGPYTGTGCLTCSPALACRISGALLMGEYAAVDEEVLDAMGEVTNMVIGNVKTVLEEEVGAMWLSIPTVIFGRNFTTRSAGHHTWTVIPFHVDDETLLVKVFLVLSPDNKPSRVPPEPVALR